MAQEVFTYTISAGQSKVFVGFTNISIHNKSGSTGLVTILGGGFAQGGIGASTAITLAVGESWSWSSQSGNALGNITVTCDASSTAEITGNG